MAGSYTLPLPPVRRDKLTKNLPHFVVHPFRRYHIALAPLSPPRQSFDYDLPLSLRSPLCPPLYNGTLFFDPPLVPLVSWSVGLEGIFAPPLVLFLWRVRLFYSSERIDRERPQLVPLARPFRWRFRKIPTTSHPAHFFLSST